MTSRLRLLARRSSSCSADRSKLKSCPTNRDKYTFPLLSLTLVFPTLLKPSYCSNASSEEMTDHIKRLTFALTGEIVPAFKGKGDVLAFTSRVESCLCAFWKWPQRLHVQMKLCHASYLFIFLAISESTWPDLHQMLQRNDNKPWFCCHDLVTIVSTVLAMWSSSTSACWSHLCGLGVTSSEARCVWVSSCYLTAPSICI